MLLPFVINPSAPAPIFQQIADGLRAAIGRGALAPGTLLPGVRSIAEQLGVNPNTVHKAVSELEREGLIRAERGRGMVVNAGSRKQARETGEEALLETLGIAARQGLDAGLTEERITALLRRALRAAAAQQTGAHHEQR